MAWQPPSTDSVPDTGWQPPASDAIPETQAQGKPSVGILDSLSAASELTPWSKVRQGLDTLGGNIAEKAGELGYPKTGVALGAIPSVGPDILSAGSALEGLYTSESPIAQGITKTPQQIGQEMKVGEQSAGISGQLPVRSGLAARFPKTPSDVITVTPEGTAIPGGGSLSNIPGITPTSYPKNTNSLLNFMKQRIDQYGENLPVQELADYKRMLPEMFNKMEVARGTPQYALASDINNKVSNLYAKAIPGREAQNAAYQWATRLQPNISDAVKNFIQKYGKQALKEAIGVGAGIAGAGALKDLFK